MSISLVRNNVRPADSELIPLVDYFAVAPLSAQLTYGTVRQALQATFGDAELWELSQHVEAVLLAGGDVCGCEPIAYLNVVREELARRGL